MSVMGEIAPSSSRAFCCRHRCCMEHRADEVQPHRIWDHVSCLEVTTCMASPAWPPVVRCRQSVSQLFPPHSVSKRKADGRRLPPPCASREIYVKSDGGR